MEFLLGLEFWKQIKSVLGIHSAVLVEPAKMTRHVFKAPLQLAVCIRLASYCAVVLPVAQGSRREAYRVTSDADIGPGPTVVRRRETAIIC